MKLTAREKKAVEMLRKLDASQRDEVLERMRRDLLANRITMRAGGMRRLKIKENKRIERAFGTAPNWKLRVRTEEK